MAEEEERKRKRDMRERNIARSLRERWGSRRREKERLGKNSELKGRKS